MARNGGGDDGDWHLDKKVPIGLLVMIVIQTITLVYVGTTWKSDIDNRLVNLERSEAQTAPNGTRLTILEQKFDFISGTLSRIERKLEKSMP